MTGLPTKWPEKRFVDADVLDRDERVLADELDHAVEHEKRITVRQRVEDAADIEFGLVPASPSPDAVFLRAFLRSSSSPPSALVSSALIAWPGPRAMMCAFDRQPSQR